MEPGSGYYRIYTARAPINIAVIKYWGKANESLKIPLNDSLSGTLNIDEMCATTTIAISDKFATDKFKLNNCEQDLDKPNFPVKLLLNEIRKLSKLDTELLNCKAHIVSLNNFPTAAGLASSAAGFACLAFVLGHAFDVTDLAELSKLARLGSGSACRSLYGGFVHWMRGKDHNSSKAHQLVDHEHWPEMRVIICVANDSQKDVSSSSGMARSVRTSPLIQHRADKVVPERIREIREAIRNRDFQTFADITMQDSNQFHAICLDTFPPLFYLNDCSRQIIRICSIINAHYGCNKVAYTFDAGPNACIYLLQDFVPQFIAIMKSLFPVRKDAGDIEELEVKGSSTEVVTDPAEMTKLAEVIQSTGLQRMTNGLNYLIRTSVGGGPKLIEQHLADNDLET